MTTRDDDETIGWAVAGAAVGAVVIAISMFYINTDATRINTASNERPGVLDTSPTGAPTLSRH